MDTTTISHRLALPYQALLFDLEAFYGQLQRVKDHRHRRGVRYPLAKLLMIGLLAKLAGQTSSRAIVPGIQARTAKDECPRETEQEVHYGITSLSTAAATPNDSWRWFEPIGGSKMDSTIGVTAPWMEDRSQLRMGHAPHRLALLNNSHWLAGEARERQSASCSTHF